ncbi:MAG TPA: hypothetical protein VFB80_09145 [Pirellulaceae bacterium]|nr:hypothetical protein [Pirellulaceae bacterium]
MSNPLLRPNDPRFHKPEVRDEAGQNRFGDTQPAGEAKAADAGVFAAAAVEEARPYQPRYEAQQSARGGLLMILAGGGLVCGLLGMIALLEVLRLGWVFPLLGLGPAAAAWLLAHEDLKAIAVGAIDETGRPRTRRAFWLGLAALLLCLGVVGSMVWRQMNFLPAIL